MLKDDDLRLDMGRCEGGTFLRLVHVPTGISRALGPLRGAKRHELVEAWRREIEVELKTQGFGQYISSNGFRRDSPKRLCRSEAEAEAVRMAREFAAENGAGVWTCVDATPDVFSTGYERRKNFVKWNVVFDRAAAGGAIVDGPVIVQVNLETGEAEFA